jgi:hypothetical protein
LIGRPISELVLIFLFLFQRASGSRIDEEMLDLPPEIFGRPKADSGTWASCVRVVDPIEVRFLSSAFPLPFWPS